MVGAGATAPGRKGSWVKSEAARQRSRNVRERRVSAHQVGVTGDLAFDEAF
jgi:hypothetical protein